MLPLSGIQFVLPELQPEPVTTHVHPGTVRMRCYNKYTVTVTVTVTVTATGSAYEVPLVQSDWGA
jgi:hypothetical protein